MKECSLIMEENIVRTLADIVVQQSSYDHGIYKVTKDRRGLLGGQYIDSHKLIGLLNSFKVQVISGGNSCTNYINFRIEEEVF